MTSKTSHRRRGRGRGRGRTQRRRRTQRGGKYAEYSGAVHEAQLLAA